MVSPISSVSSIGGVGRIIQPTTDETASPGFASKMQGALESVSSAEAEADLKVQDMAAGGDTPIHEVMIASTKASLSVELLVQTRNKAIEAYQEIMRMQV